MASYPKEKKNAFIDRISGLEARITEVERSASRDVVLSPGQSVWFGQKTEGNRLEFNAALNRYEFYINGVLVDTIS